MADRGNLMSLVPSVCVPLLLTLLYAPEKDVQLDPRVELKTAIPAARELLVKERYKEFILKYAHPEELAEVLKRKNIDELAKSFGESKAQPLLEILKQIEGQQPRYEKEGTVAVFKTKDSRRDAIQWAKHKGLWYIQN